MNQREAFWSLEMDYIQLYIFRHPYTHWPSDRFSSRFVG